MFQNHVHPQLDNLSPVSSLCFTGHRPERLPGGAALLGLKETLHYYIRCAIDHGYTTYFTGLADGVDYLAMDYLFCLREIHPEILVIGMQPCQDYDSFYRRRGYNLSHLEEMRRNADRVIVLPGFSHDKGIFLQRNRVMVDQCTGMIAVCDDGRSGSMSAFTYARSKGLAYCRIFPTPPQGTVPPPQEWRIEEHGFLS